MKGCCRDCSYACRATRFFCQLALGLIFLGPGIGDLLRPEAFLDSVVNYQLLPMPLNYLVAASLPGVMLLVGLVLLAGLSGFFVEVPFLPLFVPAAAWIATGLLVIFIGGMSMALARGIELDCGCFDTVGEYLGEYIPIFKSTRVSLGTVFRDAFMLLLAYPLIRKS